MVNLDIVQDSNAQIASSISPGLVAVFVGGTNGIGEATLKQLAKYAKRPRIYFTGRSQEAADRIINECNKVNKDGEYNFIKADTSLLKTVDEVCHEIQQKEEEINLLFLSTGTLIFGTKTEEDLHYAMALIYYSRIRFIVNLLPQLKKAKGLCRVVSVHTGTKEGAVDLNDFPRYNKGFKEGRKHASSMLTLSMGYLAIQAPTVSFIHDYPGFVKTGINRGASLIIRAIYKVIEIVYAYYYISIQESGERHLFLSTSAAFPAANTNNQEAGVPLVQGMTIARGYDGKNASGMYSIDEKCQSANQEVQSILCKLRNEEISERIIEHTKEEFKRITDVEGFPS